VLQYHFNWHLLGEGWPRVLDRDDGRPASSGDAPAPPKEEAGLIAPPIAL
jgi:hypothetical protein